MSQVTPSDVNVSSRSSGMPGIYAVLALPLSNTTVKMGELIEIPDVSKVASEHVGTLKVIVIWVD